MKNNAVCIACLFFYYRYKVTKLDEKKLNKAGSCNFFEMSDEHSFDKNKLYEINFCRKFFFFSRKDNFDYLFYKMGRNIFKSKILRIKKGLFLFPQFSGFGEFFAKICKVTFTVTKSTFNFGGNFFLPKVALKKFLGQILVEKISLDMKRTFG